MKVIIAYDIITGGSFIHWKEGAKVLHRQSRAVCSGFSYLDGSAEWFARIRTRWLLIEVDTPYGHRNITP